MQIYCPVQTRMSVCVHAATDNLNSNRYECWARSQTKYVLGSDGVGRSFMVGFGINPPVQAHHRAASCPDPPAACTFDNFNADTANPHVLYGAMVGGEAFDCLGSIRCIRQH